MSSVKPGDRIRLKDNLKSCYLGSAAELTFAISQLMINYVDQRCAADQTNFSEQMSLEVMAAADEAKLEWRARVHQQLQIHLTRANGDHFQDLIRKLNI